MHMCIIRQYPKTCNHIITSVQNYLKLQTQNVYYNFDVEHFPTKANLTSFSYKPT